MAEPLARIARVTDLGMIALRGDHDRLARAAGLPAPAPLSIAARDGRILAWMSPDEALLMLPRADLPQTLAELERELAGEHALVMDMSDARAVFEVTGPGAADVLSKLAPVDAAALPDGHLRRTRLAQTAAGIWRVAGGFRVMGFASTADYLGRILKGAAIPGSGLAPR